ncbi:hypothetical protein V6Z12_D06G033400 [Gossypium hirsutum]
MAFFYNNFLGNQTDFTQKKPRKQSFSPPSVTNSEPKRINSSQNPQTNKLLNGKRISIHVQSRKCKRKTIQHIMNGFGFSF